MKTLPILLPSRRVGAERVPVRRHHPAARAGRAGNLLPAGLLLALLVVRAAAQISVEVVLEQDQFLPGEPMELGIRIANRSGQTLGFGPASQWLTVRIEGDGMYMAEASTELPDGTSFSLDSPKQATKRINVAPFFQLEKPGRYQVSVRVQAPGFAEPIVSPTKKFDVITGNRLWEQPFGLPNSGSPPRVRTYALQQANYLKHLQLYLRVTEGREQHPVAVVRLGQMVSFGHPTAMLDRTNDLHVIFQNGARSFRYCVLTPDGTIQVRHTYTISDSRPRLVVDEQGAVSIKGGLRAPSGDDLPPDTALPLVLPDLPIPVPVPSTNHAVPPRS
jgi:hypothetical protein